MYGVSYGRLPLFKVCGGASPSCRRNPLALARGGSQRTDEARKEKISKAFTGPNHPNWQGGSHKIDKRGAGWQRLRKQVTKRDSYKCCHCGIDRDQQFERYGRDFSINHIIPFHQSGNTIKANKLSNLETLCDSCHTKADWKYRKENPMQGVLNFGRSA